MEDRDEFNLRLETLHKTVKVKTKPGKPLPGATAVPKRSNSKAKPKTNSPLRQTAVEPASVAVPAPVPASPPKEDPKASVAPAPDQVAPERKIKYLGTESKYIDRTLDRRHKVKNTFSSVFPAYGLPMGSDTYTSEMTLMSKDLDKAESVNWSYHMKSDAIKRYTEEMLKAANMRGAKK